MNFFEAMTEGVSIPLTTLATGYRPVGLIGDQVFPVARHIMSSGKIPTYSKDSLRIYNSKRAATAKSNRITPTPDGWLPFACQEHDLALPLDSQQIEELKKIPGDRQLTAMFDMQNRTRRRVQWNLALGREQEIAQKVQNAANYTSGNTVTLTNGDCWSEDNSTPVNDIEVGREVVREAIGMYPNTLVLGASAYKTLKFHNDYTDKMKLTNDKVVRPDLIANVHDLKRVIIGMSMYSNGGTLTDLWSDNALLCYIPDTETPDIEEPGFGYQVVPEYSSTPYPYVDLFTEEGGKIINVRCTDKYDLLFTMSHAGYLIKNAQK